MPHGNAEKWKTVPLPPWNEKYEVSDSGRVRRRFGKMPGGPLIVTRNTTGGYRQVNLSHKGVKKTFRVHQLVLMAFHRLPKLGEVTNHINADRCDNRIANLEWCTLKENNEHTSRMGRHRRGTNHHLGKMDNATVFAMRNSGMTLQQIGDLFGATRGAVYAMVKRAKKAGLYPYSANAQPCPKRNWDSDAERFRDEYGRFAP